MVVLCRSFTASLYCLKASATHPAPAVSPPPPTCLHCLQMHAAISQDRQAVAAAGTCGLAVYSRRARRWRLFGDATQERSMRVRYSCPVSGMPPCGVSVMLPGVPECPSSKPCRSAGAHPPTHLPPACASLLPSHWAHTQVQGLMWLPGGIVAAVAHVSSGSSGGRGSDAGGAGAPQLLLYPHDHLDAASLLARLPLQQVGCAAWGGRAVGSWAPCVPTRLAVVAPAAACLCEQRA